jgi:hypothetical protein
LEDGLVGLEHHARVHLKVFIEVHPGSVRAWLSTISISEHPSLLLLEELDRGLVLGEQSIADANVALWSPSNNYGLTLVLVVVDLSSRRTSKDFQFKFVLSVFFVDVQALLQVNLLLLLLVVSWLHVLLNVGVAVEERICYNVYNDVSLADIDQHVILEYLD